jgi:hypothetical protein
MWRDPGLWGRPGRGRISVFEVLRIHTGISTSGLTSLCEMQNWTVTYVHLFSALLAFCTRYILYSYLLFTDACARCPEKSANFLWRPLAYCKGCSVVKCRSMKAWQSVQGEQVFWRHRSLYEVPIDHRRMRISEDLTVCVRSQKKRKDWQSVQCVQRYLQSLWGYSIPLCVRCPIDTIVFWRPSSLCARCRQIPCFWRPSSLCQVSNSYL